MCTPPFCEPARRCLGCVSLRRAASLILILNAVYGLLMVVIHMFVFRERSRIMGAMKVDSKVTPGLTTPPPLPGHGGGGGITARHGNNWFLQVLDLDIAWAHGVLGLTDWYLCLLGLLYGLAIIGFSIFVLHAVITYNRTAGVVTRWMMMFCHLELILYIALVVVKLPLLCKAKRHFLTLMDEDCSVLRWMYMERALTRIILGALCCWVFSSFAYLLAWGDAAVDDPTLDDIDQDVRYRTPYRTRVSPAGVAPVSRLPVVEEVVRTGTRSSFDRVLPVGDPVVVRDVYDQPRYISGTAKSFSGVSGAGSFSAARYAPQYSMPRASSSIQSNVSEAERQMLIKPPVVIH